MILRYTFPMKAAVPSFYIAPSVVDRRELAIYKAIADHSWPRNSEAMKRFAALGRRIGRPTDGKPLG